jgi:excisionase family DNA binding protein
VSAAEQRLYDLKDTALYLQSLGAKSVTISFVRELVNSGTIAHLRIGKKFFVTRNAIDGWLARVEKRIRP